VIHRFARPDCHAARSWRHRVIHLCLLASLALTLPGPGTAAGKRMVCWTEDSGARACGDSIPPRYAGSKKEILDSSGRTIKVIPGTLSPEQRAAKAEQAERDAVAQREAERQAAYERALLTTYAQPQELAALRDDRLATIDTRIRLTEAAAARDAVSVAELRARLPESDAGKPAPAALLQKIAEFEASLASNQRAVIDMRRQRDEICTTFARDMRRYQQLKSGSVAFESPCPAPGAFAPAEDQPADVSAARAFFDHFVELERRFDPARFELYAPDAVVRVQQADAQGRPELLELTLEEHRERVLRELPAAQARYDTYTYEDLSAEAGDDGRVHLRARRISDLDRQVAPFTLVVRPDGESWEVVELQAGTTP
jgi:hypothetical protein